MFLYCPFHIISQLTGFKVCRVVGILYRPIQFLTVLFTDPVQECDVLYVALNGCCCGYQEETCIKAFRLRLLAYSDIFLFCFKSYKNVKSRISDKQWQVSWYNVICKLERALGMYLYIRYTLAGTISQYPTWRGLMRERFAAFLFLL